jgi:hypothetical protein
MPSPSPKPVSVSTIKSKLLRPALTSHFQCWFNPPIPVRDWSKYKENAGAGAEYNSDTEELFSLLCHEASLPGSSLATIDIDNDYHGVSQKNVYRRVYDDRADFTFYVDTADKNDQISNNYKVIQFFENWISYTVDEQFTDRTTNQKRFAGEGIEKSTYAYRVNYPVDYKSSTIYINKFERDFNGRFLQYRLLQAFPIAINSMPISYDQSQLLKCTVSFNYERYVITTTPNSPLPKTSQGAESNINTNYFNSKTGEYKAPYSTETQQLIDKYNQPLS